MYTSIFFACLFLLFFVIIIVLAGNSLLRSMLDNLLGAKKEHFENNQQQKTSDEPNITDLDACRKIDMEFEGKLNCQTTSNIPLTPIKNSFFINDLFENNSKSNEYDLTNDLKQGKECMKIPKLLYDGIWDSNNISDGDGNETDAWKLTNGNLSSGIYCSNDMLKINKPIPDNFKDMSSTPCIKGGTYYTYYNDENDDKNDYELACFEDVFNAGIY